MEPVIDPTPGLLLDLPLVPDPLQADQLSGDAGLPDFWCHGARIALTQLGVALLSEPADRAELRLRATFHAPPEARFRSASVQLALTAPEGARITSIDPVRRTGGSAERELGREVKAEVKTPVGTLGGTMREKVVRTEVAVEVRGSLSGSPSLAYWTFDEAAPTGIGHQHDLTLNLPPFPDIELDVQAAGTVIRAGRAGGLDIVRNLVSGPEQHHSRVRMSLFGQSRPATPTRG